MKMAKDVWCALVNFVTAEWLLSVFDCPNGGGTIAARSIWSTMWVYIIFIGFKHLLNPYSAHGINLVGLRLGLLHTLTFFCAIFAGVYSALYARFASQWTYLSHVYNDIKKAEVSGVQDKDALSEWKAGFMEDAEEVQLATKAMFASVIKEWGTDPNVRDKFIAHTLGKEPRYHRLMGKVMTVCSQYDR